MKIDYKKIRLIPTKRKAVVKDPPRYPNLINPIEKEMKSTYTLSLNKMIVDLTEEMINLKQK